MGQEIDRRSLALLDEGRDADAAAMRRDLNEVELAVVSSASDALIEHDLRDCSVEQFAETAEAELSPEFRTTGTSWSVGGVGDRTDLYDEWRSRLVTTLERALAPVGGASSGRR